MGPYAVDDTVASVLAGLTGASLEHIGLIYQDGADAKSTSPQSSQQKAKVRANIIIPKGSLRALYHNHPVFNTRRDFRGAGGGESFSDDDKTQARKLGVPSYILTPTRRVLKFDPKTNEVSEVLAQLDLAEISKLRTSETIRTAGAHNTLVK
ncbi:MAG: hypothetical protein A3E01_07135 [Gammaproteobacteria bacterium RIFCSPHIGHO2_12_FULL_63_22]|nr:MAG: hypothetical protein A3E01_07135 [Gammaproteobacteria bacterium RIFCSPHIGHO2_12_FULL_63_22]